MREFLAASSIQRQGKKMNRFLKMEKVSTSTDERIYLCHKSCQIRRWWPCLKSLVQIFYLKPCIAQTSITNTLLCILHCPEVRHRSIISSHALPRSLAHIIISHLDLPTSPAWLLYLTQKSVSRSFILVANTT